MMKLTDILKEIKKDLKEFETYTEYSIESNGKSYSTNKFTKAMDYINDNNLTNYTISGLKNGKWEVIDINK